MSDSQGPSTELVPVPEAAHEWHKVLDPDELPDGRVTTVSVGRRTLAVTHVDGRFEVMSNRCPHQGGPLTRGGSATRSPSAPQQMFAWFRGIT